MEPMVGANVAINAACQWKVGRLEVAECDQDIGSDFF